MAKALATNSKEREADARVDLELIARGVRLILEGIGEDPQRAGLVETPRRVAEMFAELTAGMHEDAQEHVAPLPGDKHDEMVIVKDISIASICEHHLLPFHGVAHIGYLPADRIAGLSKLARVVELFARRLQLQERLTTQVADWLQTRLEPKGVGVVLEAEHLCMTLRGGHAAGARTVTSALHGLLRTDPRSRQEFLALTGTTT